MITHDTVSVKKKKYRPYFENYTVDASILETCAFELIWLPLGVAG